MNPTMTRARRRAVLRTAGALVGGTLLPIATARAQAFPDKPVRVVVPFAAGNTLDTALRQLAVEFRRITGQNLIVDNRPGGGGAIAAVNVMQSPPDGTTLLLSNTSILAINPHTHARLPYDARTSFRPVTGFLGASLALAVNTTNVPATNLREFVDWAKGRAGGVSYASFTPGGAAHFCGVIFNERSGLSMTHVPYNGTPPAVQNLVGGQVDSAFLPPLAVKPHLASGRVRILAVSSPQRSPLLPDVATFTEQGFPELEIYIWSGLSAPAGTPDATIERLNQIFVEALKTDDIGRQWRGIDFEPLPMTPPQFAAYVDADSARWAKAVRTSGFKANE